jgi:hypothetical protein
MVGVDRFEESPQKTRKEFKMFLLRCFRIVSYNLRLSKKFKKFNNMLFGGMIYSKPNFCWDNSSKELGHIHVECDVGIGPIENVSITFSKLYALSEQLLDHTLIHEMIHLKLAEEKIPKFLTSLSISARMTMSDTTKDQLLGHGEDFRQLADKCSKILKFPVYTQFPIQYDESCKWIEENGKKLYIPKTV